MVTDDIAYAEVFEILSYMNRSAIMKIPVEVIQYIKENRNTEYISNINPNNIFNPQNVSDKAREILAWLDITYLATNESKKEKLKLYKENEEKFQAQLREKYKIDRIYEKSFNDNNDVSKVENVQMIEYKETKWYKKIWKKILKILRRN